MNDLMKVEVSAFIRDWCPYRKRQQRTGSFSLFALLCCSKKEPNNNGGSRLYLQK